jgi:small subunit ribosomal protein S2
MRWLGGTLTNWQTIRQRIDYLDKLEQRRDAGDFDLLKKTERLRIEREIDKLNERLGGIRKMRTLPDVLFVVDVNNEDTAVHEANILDIPIIGIVDTNSDPDPIEYIIPSNDDAIRAIKLITGKMADAALEGMAMREESMTEEISDFDDYEDREFDGMGNVEDEVLLGESTLAKLREQAVEEEVVEAVAEAVVAEEIAEIVAEAVIAEEIAEIVEETIVEEEIAEVAEEEVIGEDEENE